MLTPTGQCPSYELEKYECLSAFSLNIPNEAPTLQASSEAKIVERVANQIGSSKSLPILPSVALNTRPTKLSNKLSVQNENLYASPENTTQQSQDIVYTPLSVSVMIRSSMLKMIMGA